MVLPQFRTACHAPPKHIAQKPQESFFLLQCSLSEKTVVVREDHGGGIVREAAPHYFARVHAGAVDRAAEQLLERDHAVAVVEEHAREHFVRVGDDARAGTARTLPGA